MIEDADVVVFVADSSEPNIARTIDYLFELREHARRRAPDADDKLARLPLPLPCNLDCVGAIDGVAVYIGLMPEAIGAPAAARSRGDPRALLCDQLEPAVATSLCERAVDLDHVLARLPGVVQTEGIVPVVAALLRA